MLGYHNNLSMQTLMLSKRMPGPSEQTLHALHTSYARKRAQASCRPILTASPPQGLGAAGMLHFAPGRASSLSLSSVSPDGSFAAMLSCAALRAAAAASSSCASACNVHLRPSAWSWDGMHLGVTQASFETKMCVDSHAETCDLHSSMEAGCMACVGGPGL